MHNAQHFLYWEKTIGYHAEKKRRDNRANGTCHVCEIDHIRHPMTLHIVSTRGIPCAPDKELQKHHDTEAGLRVSKHGQLGGLKCLCQYGLLYELFHILK